MFRGIEVVIAAMRKDLGDVDTQMMGRWLLYTLAVHPEHAVALAAEDGKHAVVSAMRHHVDNTDIQRLCGRSCVPMQMMVSDRSIVQ